MKIVFPALLLVLFIHECTSACTKPTTKPSTAPPTPLIDEVSESPIYTASSCEKGYITLNCTGLGVIKVLSAFFGRIGLDYCGIDTCIAFEGADYCNKAFTTRLNTNCTFPNTTQTIGAAANGKVKYTYFNCNAEYLGLKVDLNPCLWTWKYGNVTYQCVPIN